MLIPAYKVQEIALHLIYINKLKKKKKRTPHCEVFLGC